MRVRLGRGARARRARRGADARRVRDGHTPPATAGAPPHPFYSLIFLSRALARSTLLARESQHPDPPARCLETRTPVPHVPRTTAAPPPALFAHVCTFPPRLLTPSAISPAPLFSDVGPGGTSGLGVRRPGGKRGRKVAPARPSGVGSPDDPTPHTCGDGAGALGAEGGESPCRGGVPTPLTPSLDFWPSSLRPPDPFLPPLPGPRNRSLSVSGNRDWPKEGLVPTGGGGVTGDPTFRTRRSTGRCSGVAMPCTWSRPVSSPRRCTGNTGCRSSKLRCSSRTGGRVGRTPWSRTTWGRASTSRGTTCHVRSTG